MSKLFSGSLCLSDIVEQAKKGHSAFSKSQKNGKVYFNFLLWENDEVDKYDNTHSLQLNSTKDKKDAEGKVYIGNAKPIEAKLPGKNDLPGDDWDNNVPVRDTKQGEPAAAPSDITTPVDDIPF